MSSSAPEASVPASLTPSPPSAWGAEQRLALTRAQISQGLCKPAGVLLLQRIVGMVSAACTQAASSKASGPVSHPPHTEAQNVSTSSPASTSSPQPDHFS